MKSAIICMLLILFTSCSIAQEKTDPPTPYEYKYDVNADDNKNKEHVYFGKQESGDEKGKVTGNYYVLLPDNRLLKVVYEVDGESGFKPVLTYEDNANIPPATQAPA